MKFAIFITERPHLVLMIVAVICLPQNDTVLNTINCAFAHNSASDDGGVIMAAVRVINEFFTTL